MSTRRTRVLIGLSALAIIAAWYALMPLFFPTAIVRGSKNFSSLGEGMERYASSRYGFTFKFPAATPVFVSLSSSPSASIDAFGGPAADVPPLAVIITPTSATTAMPTVFRLSPQACQPSGGQSFCTLLADNGRVKLILGSVPQNQYQKYQNEFQQIIASFARN